MAVILTNTGVQFPSGTTQTDPFVNGSVTRDKIGYSGAILQMAYARRAAIDYANGIGSTSDHTTALSASGFVCSITTTKANSKIQFKANMFIGGYDANGYQHTYLDIRRSTDNVNFTSLVQAQRPSGGGSAIDAFAGRHADTNSGTSGDGGETFLLHTIDTPNVAAGTTLYYKIYFGQYTVGTNTANLGGHNGNHVNCTTIVLFELNP